MKKTLFAAACIMACITIPTAAKTCKDFPTQ